MNTDIAASKANDSNSFTIHNEFLNLLLDDISIEGMEKHYNYFQNATNPNLKRVLGKGFLKRGKVGIKFLSDKLKTENDKIKKSNVIHLLGLTNNKDCLSDIYPFLQSENYDLRYKAIVSIGWLADQSTIDLLINHYSREKDPLLRGFTITAMRQIFFRYADTKEQILSFLLPLIKKENEIEVMAIMIVVFQDLTKTKYGLKEDANTGEISGDVFKTKEKIIKKFQL